MAAAYVATIVITALQNVVLTSTQNSDYRRECPLLAQSKQSDDRTRVCPLLE
jgi:hypothetical protein